MFNEYYFIYLKLIKHAYVLCGCIIISSQFIWNMKKLLGIFLLHLTFITTKTLASPNIDALLDSYEDWYNRRSEEALHYELPTDARMYEAENQNLQGKSNCNLLTLCSFLWEKYKSIHRLAFGCWIAGFVSQEIKLIYSKVIPLTIWWNELYHSFKAGTNCEFHTQNIAHVHYTEPGKFWTPTSTSTKRMARRESVLVFVTYQWVDFWRSQIRPMGLVLDEKISFQN